MFAPTRPERVFFALFNDGGKEILRTDQLRYSPVGRSKEYVFSCSLLNDASAFIDNDVLAECKGVR